MLLSLFFKKKINKDEIFSFLESVGGQRQKTDFIDQVVVEKSNGILWCYYRGDEFNLDLEEELELRKYIACVKTEIAIELSSDKESKLLVKNICERLANKFGDFIIYSNGIDFYYINQLNRL